MPITPKACRTLCSRKEHDINKEIAKHRFVQDTFWRMAVANHVRDHKYYRRQYRKLRTGEITQLTFAKEAHKSYVLVVDSDGTSRTCYEYAMNTIAAINTLIESLQQELTVYQQQVQQTVSDTLQE